CCQSARTRNTALVIPRAFAHPTPCHSAGGSCPRNLLFVHVRRLQIRKVGLSSPLSFSPRTLRAYLCALRVNASFASFASFTSSTSFPSFLSHLLRHGLPLQEQQQIILPAALRVRPAHIESAKRMRPHHRSRAFPVQVQIPHVELLLRAANLLRILRVQRARQPKFGVI